MRYLWIIPLMFLASCSLFKPGVNSELTKNLSTPSLAGTEWELVSIPEFAGEKDLERPATMGFEGDSTHSVYGNGGCNYYNGVYKVEAKKINFSRLLSTKKYCAVGSKTETQLTAALLRANRYGVDADGQLILMEGKNVVAVFKPGRIKESNR